MSQRIHTCVNNTNLETIQCDAYQSRLIPKEKGGKYSSKPSTRTSSVSSNKLLGKSGKQDSVLRKELYVENDGRVEVTVKTHNGKERSRYASSHNTGTKHVWSNGGNKEPGIGVKETWGRVLKSQNSQENLSSFMNFDPLRTVHFLAQELLSKLQVTLPDDQGIQTMVNEMNQALSRVPPDVPSSNEPQLPANPQKDKYDMQPTKLTNNFKENYYPKSNPLIDNTCQTPRSLYVEPEKLERHLVESSRKIENACAQMEALCAKLKTEKMELESLLKAERDETRSTKKQLEEERLKFHTTSALVENLQTQNQELETELRKVRVQLESQQGPSAQELRTFIQDLQKKKENAEEECITLKQQLMLAKLEAEKFETVLQARDNQVKEIRNEMTQLQEVVNEQLMELQNHHYSSDVSSVSNLTGGRFCS